jgi:uroporphyrinogen III methyltransferase/synthase
VERGTLPGQRTVSGTLADIAARVQEAGLRAPAITVVGPVARLRETLGWAERRPLFGRSVVVTRARAQASGLARRLADLGADVVEAPAIRIEPRDDAEVARAAERIREYALVVLTSPNGAKLLVDRLRDARELAGVTVAAIGPGTAAELERHGVRADVVPERSVAEALVEALRDVPVEGKRVLVARAAEARDVLPDALNERGAHVDVVALYDTVPEPLGDEQAKAAASADYMTFTSSSTVRFLMRALDGRAPDQFPRVVSIGPVTSATAREHGLTVAVEAERHDVDGLVAALVEDASR